MRGIGGAVMLVSSALILLLVCSCTFDDSDEPDQCLRQKLFVDCLSVLPAGPTATVYNDWAEVVSECGSKAYYHSLRAKAHIKPECRAN